MIFKHFSYVTVNKQIFLIKPVTPKNSVYPKIDKLYIQNALSYKAKYKISLAKALVSKLCNLEHN